MIKKTEYKICESRNNIVGFAFRVVWKPLGLTFQLLVDILTHFMRPPSILNLESGCRIFRYLKKICLLVQVRLNP